MGGAPGDGVQNTGTIDPRHEVARNGGGGRLQPEYRGQLDGFSRDTLRAAKGNWDAFPVEQIEVLCAAAKEWRKALDGIEKPWLCWNVEPNWCRIQQRLVLHAGWTPVVGSDPRAERAEMEPGAVQVDFNESFGFPIMHFLFPVEVMHWYAPKLAFWHSDLLISFDEMSRLAREFEELPQGSTAAVDARRQGRWYRRVWTKKRRYWELVGCTTAEASRSQYESGMGWWRNFWSHPNIKKKNSRKARRRYEYEHGSGILAWEELMGGDVRKITHGRVRRGHCTRINNPNFKRVSPQDDRRDPGLDIRANYDLATVCRRIGIESAMENWEEKN